MSTTDRMVENLTKTVAAACQELECRNESISRLESQLENARFGNGTEDALRLRVRRVREELRGEIVRLEGVIVERNREIEHRGNTIQDLRAEIATLKGNLEMYDEQLLDGERAYYDDGKAAAP